MAVRFQLRRGTASQWTSANTTLLAGEVGFETDTRRFKVGDGTTAWTSLAYANFPLPSQTGNAGFFLTTDGTNASWATDVVRTSATQTLTSKTLTNATIVAPKEMWTLSATPAGGVVNFDVNTQGVLYLTQNATSNFTINVRGNSTTTLNSSLGLNESVSFILINTNGTSGFYATTFQIDGVTVTPKWTNGTAISFGNPNALDVYTMTVVKTAATPTYTMLANMVRFA